MQANKADLATRRAANAGHPAPPARQRQRRRSRTQLDLSVAASLLSTVDNDVDIHRDGICRQVFVDRVLTRCPLLVAVFFIAYLDKLEKIMKMGHASATFADDSDDEGGPLE